MNQREHRRHENPVPAASAPAGTPNGAGLNAIRLTAASMLDAADEAINNVLSGDSEAFNAAMRQQGGQ